MEQLSLLQAKADKKKEVRVSAVQLSYEKYRFLIEYNTKRIKYYYFDKCVRRES